jgi:tetratricopeptide (TPR) repeat protein
MHSSDPGDERKLADHLQRAGELLKSNQLDGAEKEIEAALSLRRDDVRARNLRGLFLFRGNRYEEAEKIYVELCDKWPEDAALRLNLGLVELRMGKFGEAAANLKKVIAAEPDNGRAQGYLGLALMRTGELQQAHGAFLKAGQTELARQIEVQLQQKKDGAQAVGELRDAAAHGQRTLEKEEQPFAAVELDAPVEEAGRHNVGEWQLREAGQAAPLPGGVEAASPLRLLPAEPVTAFATRRLLRAPTSDEPFLLADGGMLVMRVDGRLPTRTLGTVASTEGVTFEPLFRRVRAQSTQEAFGEGAEAMLMAVGHGRIVVAARGARFSVLALADDILYLREPTLFAFEESLAWESGRLPGGGAQGDAARIVQFRGHGRVVLRTSRSIFTLKTEEAPLFVEQGALLGWIGRVVPKQAHGEDGPAPYIECHGEGVLILEEPPTISS